MKETKIKERFENAYDAFFENNKLNEGYDLNLPEEQNIWQPDVQTSFDEKIDFPLVKILKQVFLFFPGTFILFIISFAFSAISINNPFHVSLPKGRLFWVLFWFSSAILMTWFGLGDVRKPKHLVIPASILSVGVVVGAISGIISIFSPQFAEILFGNAYPLYFFPLALIIPFLAKGLVDRKNKDT